jgi:DNA invertase Pin-like site-specific DNA recombinase
LPDAAREEFIKRLGDDAADDWVFWARDAQLPPTDPGWCWLFFGGRGTGKSHSMSAAVHVAVRAGVKRIHLIARFVEVESGKRSNRPQLAAAMALAKQRKVTLLVAKLDRLSRSVSFISALMDSKGFDLAIADMPGANRLTLHVFAAEHERHAIGDRTKHALAAAKARGVKLGNPEQARINQAKAVEQAEALRPHIERCIKAGLISSNAIAIDLNAHAIATPIGGQ